MPKRPENKPIECEYFAWHLRCRNGVYYADGRGGKYDLGKHSLGTRNRAEVLKQLHQLDRKKAVELGLAKETVTTIKGKITIKQGWEQYLEYSGRSSILGGVAPGSLKRYTLIQDRHLPYCQKKGIETWNEFGKSEFEQYGNWLFRKFAYRTCYVDLTQIKSAVKWLIGENLLPADCQIHYPLRKPAGTDTYCYSQAEVSAMVEHCSSIPKLHWLGEMIVALAHIGNSSGRTNFTALAGC